MLSPADKLAALPDVERDAFIASLTEGEAAALLHSWRDFHARPDQIAPDGDWDVWLCLAGRGWGKTRTGAEWVREEVEAGRAKRIALIAETQKDLDQVMVHGDSGIEKACPPGMIQRITHRPTVVEFANGARAFGYNGTEPNQLRGPQFDLAWCDELAKWRYARETWDQLQFGLRLGEHPRQLVTTTPRPIELIKALVAGEEGRVAVTRGRTADNRTNLAKSFLSRVEGRYAGTRLGRQELEGQILGDMPGALWSLSSLDLYRVGEPPEQFERIVVAVDPAVTNTENSDFHGISVCGVSSGEGYVLADASMPGSPNDWARMAIALHNQYDADAIVAEVNQGGDMVAEVIRAVSPNVRVKEVRATRGKHIRAEPIAALYEQGRVHHVGSYPELEEQMTLTTNAGYEGEGSPDRMDALVWALTDLFPAVTEDRSIKHHRPRVQRSARSARALSRG